MTLDRLGRPHIIIANEYWCELKYGVRKDSGWNIEVVYTGSKQVNHRTGRNSDITIDNDLTPHIAFYEFYGQNGAGTIYYATFEGNEWISKIIVSNSETNEPSIALDTKETPHFSYVNTEYQLEYAKYKNGNFIKQVVFKDVEIKYRSKIDIDSKDNPRIVTCCYERDEEALFHTEWTGEAWETKTVCSGPYGSIFFFIDSNDRSHIMGCSGGSVLIAKRGLQTQCSIPTPPRDLEIKDKEGYIKLTWNRSFNDGYSEIEGYNIYRAEGNGDFQQLSSYESNYYYEYFDSDIESNRRFESILGVQTCYPSVRL
jgi:hypothetical protein